MSLTTIVFSKDRPAQLDLLLRSLKVNAPTFLKMRPRIIVRATTDAFQEGYLKVREEHSETVGFLYWEGVEGGRSFRELFLAVLRSGTGEKIAFFVDDDVIYRPLPIAHPSKFLDLFPETLCFSLRMGLNCTACYPLRCEQEEPLLSMYGHNFLTWDWRNSTAQHDWAYPASLDGGIFRRDDLLRMLEGEPYTNPNQLEEALVAGCRSTVWPNMMASFTQSVLVGVPANRVNDTHPNRYAECEGWSPEVLNATYLAGGRLSLPYVENYASLVNAAHFEIPLVWEDA